MIGRNHGREPKNHGHELAEKKMGVYQMGYETRLYVVKKSALTADGTPNEGLTDDYGLGLRYAQVIAVYDLCKCPAIERAITRPTDCYFYDFNGETQVIKDAYNQPLKEATLDEVVDAIKRFGDDDYHYRRIPPLLAMLEAFAAGESKGEWDDGKLAVLRYGH